MAFELWGAWNETGDDFIDVIVHEKNALTLSTHDLLGSASKSYSVTVEPGYTKVIEMKLETSVFERYPKKSRSPCDLSEKN